jgi:chromosome segregation ATPase
VATELLAGIGIAVGVLGASIRVAPLNLGLGLLCLLVMVAGVYVLTTSPLVTGELARLKRRQEESLALRTEAEEARDLRRAQRDLDRLQEHLADGRVRNRDRKDLEEHMEHVAEEIRRLEKLQSNIRKHRDAERERLGDARGSVREDLHTEDLELAAREGEISERADWLREQASSLQERIRSVVWVEE